MDACLNRTQPILLYGAGNFGRKVAVSLAAMGYTVSGFIDQSPGVAEWMGLPIHSWEAAVSLGVLAETQVLCTVFNRLHAYQALYETAMAHGCSDLLMPWHYYPMMAGSLGWQYWLAEEPLQVGNETVLDARVSRLTAMLADDESKTILSRTLAFRGGKDLAYSTYVSSEPQYFNQLTLCADRLPDQLVYLDVGAYDGDSLMELSGLANLKRAILFEPSHLNADRLRLRTMDWLAWNPGVELEILPMALGNHHGLMALQGEGEAAAVVADLAEDEVLDSAAILVARADDLYPSLTVDFVKIDAEGSDLGCIHGMANLLRRSRPVVAISVYHRTEDLLEIPLAMYSLYGGNCDYYLRQHYCNSFDCVLYVVPWALG